ncbi:MAG: hypothetical protein H6500_00880 [Candidatus Woesearchaeota archaeon]|nr:MAG: hypothetical protein H6500_00880 [Candidatus Woesearchaeota archaeon]
MIKQIEEVFDVKKFDMKIYTQVANQINKKVELLEPKKLREESRYESGYSIYYFFDKYMIEDFPYNTCITDIIDSMLDKNISKYYFGCGSQGILFENIPEKKVSIRTKRDTKIEDNKTLEQTTFIFNIDRDAFYSIFINEINNIINQICKDIKEGEKGNTYYRNLKKKLKNMIEQNNFEKYITQKP